MRAIFIAVGSELLELGRKDTNSEYITKKLAEHGILTSMKVVVGDDMTNLSWIIKTACKRAQLVILTGGLGPTDDDITREAAAEALKLKLVFHEEIVEKIKNMFSKRRIHMPEINTRQAFILQGAEILENSVGTAPGQYFEDEKNRLLLLPGPPREMRPIFDIILEKKISKLSKFFIYRRCFKFGGITESETDSLLSGIYRKYKNPVTTILASPGIIELHLLGRSKNSVDEAKELTDELAEKIKEKMKKFLITEKDLSVEEYIVDKLKNRGLTISTAESCTGGLLGNTLTNVAGSSQVYLGGITPYSNDLKVSLLGVDEKNLEKYGAVSKETAEEMAQKIRRMTGSDIGISITGIAGPGGGSKKKPVGLVFIHLSSSEREISEYRVFPGDRNLVKRRTVNHTLNMLNRFLKDVR